MKKCINCKYLTARDICYFCGINGAEIDHPFFRGGPKKCNCWEKNIKVVSPFPYPTVIDLNKFKKDNSK